MHSALRTSATIFDFPEVFRQYDELDSYDYAKILVDDQSYYEGYGHLFENFGISQREGCIVVLRPDQYVLYVGSIDQYDQLDRFFSGFMLTQSRSINSKGVSELPAIHKASSTKVETN